jgi:TonB family protein
VIDVPMLGARGARALDQLARGDTGDDSTPTANCHPRASDDRRARRVDMRTVLTAGVLAAVFIVSAAAQSKPVYKVGQDGVKAPVLTYEVKPIYSASAKERKVQGKVELKVVVQADGTVGDEVKVASSLDPDLDQAAITAVKQWRFNPGTKDGQAVDVTVDIEMTFTLK